MNLATHKLLLGAMGEPLPEAVEEALKRFGFDSPLPPPPDAVGAGPMVALHPQQFSDLQAGLRDEEIAIHAGSRSGKSGGFARLLAAVAALGSPPPWGWAALVPRRRVRYADRSPEESLRRLERAAAKQERRRLARGGAPREPVNPWLRPRVGMSRTNERGTWWGRPPGGAPHWFATKAEAEAYAGITGQAEVELYNKLHAKR